MYFLQDFRGLLEDLTGSFKDFIAFASALGTMYCVLHANQRQGAFNVDVAGGRKKHRSRIFLISFCEFVFRASRNRILQGF